MKKNVIGLVLLLISFLCFGLSIASWVQGLNSGNVNFIIGPIVSLIILFPSAVICLVFGLILLIKKNKR